MAAQAEALKKLTLENEHLRDELEYCKNLQKTSVGANELKEYITSKAPSDPLSPSFSGTNSYTTGGGGGGCGVL